MFTQAYSNVARTIFCTIGAVAVSSVFMFAAAGPAQASTVDAKASAASTQFFGEVSTARPIAY